MKILIDEQLPVKVKYRFADTEYKVYTVKDMGWLGKKNGELLELMIAHQFHVLLTNDKKMHFQLKIAGFDLTVININTKTNEYDDMMAVLDKLKQLLSKVALQSKHSHKTIGRYLVLS